MGIESFKNNYEAGGTGSRDKEVNPRIKLEYGGYRRGDKVSVIRSNGTLEEDWTFHHQRMDTGEIVVRKIVDSKIIEKEIPAYIFNKIQQEVEK